jgi:hypothetical protein
MSTTHLTPAEFVREMLKSMKDYQPHTCTDPSNCDCLDFDCWVEEDSAGGLTLIVGPQ